MMNTDGPVLEEPLAHVVRALVEGAHLAQRIRRERADALAKRDGTPITLADLAVQVAVTRALEQAFPHDALMAEEDATVLHTAAGRPLMDSLVRLLDAGMPGVTSGEIARLLGRSTKKARSRAWLLDPVDGTAGFLRDGGHYVVALALVERGLPSVGILACPTLDVEAFYPEGATNAEPPQGALLVAGQERGAWVSALDLSDFRPLRVSAVTSLAEARVLGSAVTSHVDPDAMRAFWDAAGLRDQVQAVDGQAKHALIAQGHAELFVRIPADASYRERVWDHAAGALILTEAGGRITDVHGHPLEFGLGTRLSRNEGIVASNGVLHDEVLDVLRLTDSKAGRPMG
jgi:3'(2'), 5'-bisphosphate nucleotidase